MSRKALIVWGGWDGHQPKQVAEFFGDILGNIGFSVRISDSLDSFADAAAVAEQHLIVPVWTMGKISKEQVQPVLAAVNSGVGIAGCHGGMCDSFRESTEWQFLTGAQWVSHPGNDGVKYSVHITNRDHEITRGIDDFPVSTEQYYLHVDPAVKILATTRFPIADGPHVSNGPVDMPVIFTKTYGKGRVFYNSLGHQVNVLKQSPVAEIMRRGLLWAAKPT
jgi:hypothetical protein